MPAIEPLNTVKRSSSARSLSTSRPKSVNELTNSLRFPSSSRVDRNRIYNVRTLSGFLLQYDEVESNILDNTHTKLDQKMRKPSTPSSSYRYKRMRERNFSDCSSQSHDENSKPDNEITLNQINTSEKSVEVIKEQPLPSLSPTSSVKSVRFSLEPIQSIVLVSLPSIETNNIRPSTPPRRKPLSPRIHKFERRTSANLPTIPEHTTLLPPI